MLDNEGTAAESTKIEEEKTDNTASSDPEPPSAAPVADTIPDSPAASTETLAE